MEIIQAFPFILVTIILVYSMSEFPLWYLRFSIIFAIAISLIDPSQIKWKSHYNSLIGIICFGMGIGSIYYYKSYLNYSYYTELTYTDQLNSKQVNQLEGLFGFTEYKEQLVYYTLPLDSHFLEQKITLGNRVLTKFPTMVYIEKQAIFYALNDEKQQSLELFKKGCLIDYKKYCSHIQENLQKNSKDNPKVFADIYNDFVMWEENNK